MTRTANLQFGGPTRSLVLGATYLEVRGHFYASADIFGLPQSVLSDNGAIYTTAYRGAHSGMEIELAILGIRYKHDKPYHPQTQGKASSVTTRP